MDMNSGSSTSDHAPLSDKELDDYKSHVFAYKRYLEEIQRLRSLKARDIDFAWLWIAVGLSAWVYLSMLIGEMFKMFLGEPYSGYFVFVVTYCCPVIIGWLGTILVKKGVLSLIENILTLGKAKRIKKSNAVIDGYIDEVVMRKDAVLVPIKKYEEMIERYYSDNLESFFQRRLFRKRSSGVGYEAALEKLAGMADEVDEVSKGLIIKHISTVGYREYLKSKNGVLGSRKYTATHITSFGQKIREISQIIEVKRFVAPEVKYRTGRLIDWDAKNAQSRKTGLRGEEIAVAIEKEYLTQLGRRDLADRVRHVAMEVGDGLGYDVLSFFADGREKFIEVKSSSQASGSTFDITKNELGFLRENPKSAYIYRVYSVNDVSADHGLEVYSAEQVISNGEIVPTRFSIKMQK